MNPRVSPLSFSSSVTKQAIALLCAALLASGDPAVFAQESPQAAAPAEAPKISPDQLDSLVAPIALYPDPLLAQTLAASTYPLEIIQLQQWMGKHKDLKDKALADAVQKQPGTPVSSRWQRSPMSSSCSPKAFSGHRSSVMLSWRSNRM